MQVYHLGHTRFADSLSGEGARLHGGRWNRIGTPCIYTSETKALSVLEYTANVRFEEMPPSLSFTIYFLPAKSFHQLTISDLPTNWSEVPAPEETKTFGTAFLKNYGLLAIRFPSIIISSEYNFIINPLANNFDTIKIMDIHPFSIDQRIKNQH